jgi:hypothetical protein
MKNALTWIKSNLITVASAIAILASIGVIGWSISYGGKEAQQTSQELDKLIRKINSYSQVTVPFPPAEVDAPAEDISGVTINDETLKRLNKVYGQMSNEYQQVFDTFVRRNHQGHDLLVPGVLPVPEASHLLHNAKDAYRQAFERMFQPYETDPKTGEPLTDEPRLNAGGPLDPVELQFELQRIEQDYRPSNYGATGGTRGNLTESDRKAIEGQQADRAEDMLKERAQQIHLYADPNIYSPGFPFQVGAWSLSSSLPSLSQVWEGHMELWIQQDIARAIAIANKVDQPEGNVISAPVKRLISIDVIPGYVGINTRGGIGVAGSDKDGASGGSAGGYGGSVGYMPTGAGAASGGGAGMGAMGMGGAGMGGAGMDGAVPAAVTGGSADEKLSVDFGTGPSGRVSNVIYDVRHARMVAIVDYQQLPKLFEAIGRVNFMTVLDCQIQDVDEYEALRQGFVYGTGDSVRIDILIESIWLRDWTTKWMPDEVKRRLGIATASADVPPEDEMIQ